MTSDPRDVPPTPPTPPTGAGAERPGPVSPERLGAPSASLARDALAIVLAGIVLGVAFNSLGLTSRPSRGLPWIAEERRFAVLDSLMPVPEGATSVQASPAPAGRAPASGVVVAPAMRVAASRGAVRDAAPAAATAMPPASAAGSDHEPGNDPPPNPAAAADLPAIPDVAHPMTVRLPTVLKFVAARAALVVDARDHDAFVGGHIPGAVNLPYDEAASDPARLGALAPAGRPIIVYCSGGHCEASRMLAEMLVQDLKWRRVLVYEGGFPEWEAAGNPVTKGNQ